MIDNSSGMTVIIVEGDMGIARFFCGCCGRSFRAELNRVTCANKQPVCLPCIDKANPERVKRGMPEIPVVRGAYYGD